MDYSNELKQAIADAITKKFGSIDDLGCYTDKAWLSTQSVFEIVCNTIDDNNYMFAD